MAQFDVHRNLGKHRDDIPYVVLVQSSLYDSYRRRVVVPLVRKAALGKPGNPRFNPSFKIEGLLGIVWVKWHDGQIAEADWHGLRD